MPDISMCVNGNCPLKTKCYRFMAVPGEPWQSFSHFKFNMDGEKAVCEDFMEIYDGSRIVSKVPERRLEQ